jgi:hypothetical protein
MCICTQPHLFGGTFKVIVAAVVFLRHGDAGSLGKHGVESFGDDLVVISVKGVVIF